MNNKITDEEREAIAHFLTSVQKRLSEIQETVFETKKAINKVTLIITKKETPNAKPN